MADKKKTIFAIYVVITKTNNLRSQWKIPFCQQNNQKKKALAFILNLGELLC